MTAAVDLHTILRQLPPGGCRLRGGLALRLSFGHGMHVLGCSRVDQPPSAVEMRTLVDAVSAVFAPGHILMARQPEPLTHAGIVHHIWRIYWPDEAVDLVRIRTHQAALAIDVATGEYV